MLFRLGIHVLDIDLFAKSYCNVRAPDKGKMVFKYLRGAGDGNRYDRASALGGNLETAGMERCYLSVFGTGSLGEDKDRDSFLDLIDGSEDDLKSLARVALEKA